MHHVEVAVPTPLNRTFTYLSEAEIAPGTRVLVPFGRRRMVGVVLGVAAQDGLASVKLKRVEAVLEHAPSYSLRVLEIARWLSSYYMYPLGEVLRAMLPASSTKTAKATCALTESGLVARQENATDEGRMLHKVFGKSRVSLEEGRLTQKLVTLLGEHDGKAALKSLVKAGLVVSTRDKSVRARLDTGRGANAAPTHGEGEAAETPRALTEEQEAVVQAVVSGGLAAPEAKKVFLLHGVTGSGKTEVYLHLIAEMLRRTGGTGQALVMVPEISLTPQMTKVFAHRFPGAVAVVHSAMSDPERWAELSRIRAGQASVLIGPRSAVFGPFRQLALLLVDEEHDGSYKQSTGLTYNGRDVAVLRGRLESATVVLGSATPSLESYQNALSRRYHLLTMPSRVSGRPLPEVVVIATERKGSSGTLMGQGGKAVIDGLDADELPLDPSVKAALTANLAAGRQAIVLVNRRGFAYYLFSVSEKKAVQCPSCSISLTLHSRGSVLRCHYCDYQTSVQRIIKEHPAETFVAVGHGSQKAEESLGRQLPGARIVRLDSDTVQDPAVLPRVLGQFRGGEIDILVGTQILAKGHDFPNVTLIVILEVDQLLGLPDFRAGERTFQLIVQAAGRAGRAELPGTMMIQTMRSTHPVVMAATKQDYREFVERELTFRRQHQYPPFTRMIAVELNGTDSAQLQSFCSQIEQWLSGLPATAADLVAKVRILGPGVPPIEKVRTRYRRTIVFASAYQDALRQVVGQFLNTFQKLPGDVRLKVDVDPQSLV